MKPVKIIIYILAVLLLNACAKEYSQEGGGLKIPSGSWEFVDSVTQFRGQMDTAYIVPSPGTATQELHLLGTSGDGSQTFHMHLFADDFTPGLYKASLFQSAFEYTMPSKTIYLADQLIGEFIVNVSSVNNNSISGTFSGAALDSGNKIRNITQGKFTSTIGGAAPLPESIGIFSDSSGNCKPVAVSGVYTQGVALTSANIVQVQVVVAVTGTYSITSNSVNGITFSGTGVFNSTGTQNVILNGSGTPAITGKQEFTISYGNSECGFAITF